MAPNTTSTPDGAVVDVRCPACGGPMPEEHTVEIAPDGTVTMAVCEDCCPACSEAMAREGIESLPEMAKRLSGAILP